MPQVNCRTAGQSLAVINPAAEIDVLSERPVITLGDEAWYDFLAALDAPVEPDPTVKARYARRPQWER